MRATPLGLEMATTTPLMAIRVADIYGELQACITSITILLDK